MKYCRMVSTGANTQLSWPTGGEPAPPPATRIRADTQLRGDRGVGLPPNAASTIRNRSRMGYGPRTDRACAVDTLVSLSDKTI